MPVPTQTTNEGLLCVNEPQILTKYGGAYWE